MAEFFEKLQDLVNLQESVEGIRDILLAVYRNGTISIKNISRVTKISIPMVSKIVNTLIERDMLTRSQENKGVQFWQHSMKFIEDFFNFYGYGIKKCPTCDGRPNYISPRFETLFETLNPIFEKRPLAETIFDQSKCSVETSIQRILYLYDCGAIEGKKVLFVGDDDFTSVALSKLYSCFFPEEPKQIPSSVTVVDIDDRILGMIERIYSEQNFQIDCINYDLRKPIPSKLANKFDTVILDPPYSLDGLKLFLSRSISMMNVGNKYSTGKDIFLSYAHRSSEKTLELQRLLTDLGLSVMEMIPRFNIYEGAEVLGNQTQMFHLKTTSSTQPLILTDESYEEKIYTGESHPYIKYYRCVECNKDIEVGADREFLTIELLKGNKCPFCKISKKFRLIKRNLDILD